jgi:pimeloyl-ACP methyl ester carboxylesterase
MAGSTSSPSLLLLGRLLAGVLVLGGLGAAAKPPFIPRNDDPAAGKVGSKPSLSPASRVIDPVEAKFVQVHPPAADESLFQRSGGQTRAIVLIHGLLPHPFRNGEVNRARLHGWQQQGSHLVKILARQADVYAFAYSQNVAVEEIAGVPCLLDGIRHLRANGYTDLVLVGHSAGGLIARLFVEDYPDAGVTKVVQVCTPNAGAGMAHFEPGVQKNQRVFLHSLSKEARAQALKTRAGKQVPAAVQFVCLIGDGAGLGDTVVSKESQWPPDLQAQGIPAVLARTMHFTVMHSPAEAQRIAELIRRIQPRLDPTQLARIKRELRTYRQVPSPFQP